MSVTSAVRDSRMSLPIMPKAPGSVNAAPPSPGFGKRSSSPRKRGSSGVHPKTLDSRLRGNDGVKGGGPRHWIPAYAGMTASKVAARDNEDRLAKTFVVPAKAGTQRRSGQRRWIPAHAGMTTRRTSFLPVDLRHAMARDQSSVEGLEQRDFDTAALDGIWAAPAKRAPGGRVQR
jgi:hypothetical protein